MAKSLSARNIVKRYGGVVALSDGNLDVYTGEVVALIGANGSGKSTMSKVINGVVVLDGGQLLLDDKPVHFSSPQAAKNMGIATVFQELSLIPQMTVAENIWLTREPMTAYGTVNRKVIKEKTEQLLSLFRGTFKTDLHADDPVASLPPDEKQIIEILKAISFDPRMITIPHRLIPPSFGDIAHKELKIAWLVNLKRLLQPYGIHLHATTTSLLIDKRKGYVKRPLSTAQSLTP